MQVNERVLLDAVFGLACDKFNKDRRLGKETTTTSIIDDWKRQQPLLFREIRKTVARDPVDCSRLLTTIKAVLR